tara:strand:- start:1653 stop:2261 length:609 start_codon:yes stop_codon:yes gene_type:complete
MAMNLGLENIINLFSALSPLLVSFLLVMISLFNQNVKGLIYLAGVLFTSIINLIVGFTLDKRKDPNASIMCDFIGIPYLTNFNVPSSSTMFHAFTIAYLIFPMYDTKNANVLLITVLSLFLIMDCVSKIKNRCTNRMGISLGVLLGALMGYVWYMIFKATGNESLLYYNEMNSNNVQCSRPSKQTFKCTVYKNGEIISQSIA